MIDEPLSVRPDVVVLDVFGKHATQEGEFGGGEGRNLRHDRLSVMPGQDRSVRERTRGRGANSNEPNLIVFEVCQ